MLIRTVGPQPQGLPVSAVVRVGARRTDSGQNVQKDPADQPPRLRVDWIQVCAELGHRGTCQRVCAVSMTQRMPWRATS
jgi:hypothetical protein